MKQAIPKVQRVPEVLQIIPRLFIRKLHGKPNQNYLDRQKEENEFVESRALIKRDFCRRLPIVVGGGDY